MCSALADQEAIYPEGLSQPKFKLACDAVIVRTNFSIKGHLFSSWLRQHHLLMLFVFKYLKYFFCRSALSLKNIYSPFASPFPPFSLLLPPSPVSSLIQSVISALQSLGAVVSVTYLFESTDLIARDCSGHRLNTEVTEHSLQSLISIYM